MSNLSQRITYFPCYGDSRILIYILKWKGFTELKRYWTHKNYNLFSFWAICLSDLVRWIFEVFSTSIRAITRRQMGNQAFGVFLSVSVFFLMALWNHELQFMAFVDFFSSLAIAFWGLLSSYEVDWQQVWSKLNRQQSIAMTIHLFVFVAFSIFHLLGIYFVKKWRDTDNPLSKGESWFYVFFKHYIKVIGKTYYNVYFEAAFFVLLGLFFWAVLGDKRYGLFLIISGSTLWVQEFIDDLVRRLHKN